MTMVERLKVKLGETGNSAIDALLETCIEDAQQDFLTYCRRVEVPIGASGLVEDMAMLRYNQLGNEGLSSQSYSGVSESYLSGYNDMMKANLNRWRKLKSL